MTEEQKIQEFGDLFTNCLREFLPIWDKVGIVEDSRKERLQVAMNHVYKLLHRMIDEEEELYQQLLENLKLLTEEEIKLSSELHLPIPDKPEGLTLLKLKKELQSRVDDLVLEKQSRLEIFKKLTAKDKHLCDSLQIAPYDISYDKIPTLEDIDELENHISEVEREKEKRIIIFHETKLRINDLMKELELTVDNNIDFEKDSMLSTENMQLQAKQCEELQQLVHHNKELASSLKEQLKSFWEKLEIDQQERNSFLAKVDGYKPKTIGLLKQELSRCKALRLKNIEMFVEKLRKEILDWWNKCLFGKEQRDLFRPYYDESYSEELLNTHDLEIQKLKKYFQENANLIEKILERDDLWKKMFEFEKRAQDPDRFNNRGGGLLQEEKERKQLLKKIPKIEKDLEAMVKNWEEKHGKVFLVNGKNHIEYLEDQKEAHRQEMQGKMKAKAAKSGPGNKRRFFGTPSKSPNKRIKIAPSSIPRVHSSLALFHSPIGKTSKSSSSKKYPANKKKIVASSYARRGILKESNIANLTFDHSTISGNVLPENAAFITSAANSYSDFAVCLNQKSEKDICRSSVVVEAKNSMKED